MPISAQTYFHDVVSGRRRDVSASALRPLLRAAEVPYTWAVNRRNYRYDQGHASVYRVEVPIVSIGNLTLGGTGKTPMVEWVARWFLDHQVKVGLISRGYGGKQNGPNDEAQELAWKLPGVPHVQNPNRVAAAREAITKFGCQALVLDDAFQHRRIARDLNIVLIDALEPTGFGHVFPRGTLREPLTGLARADVLVLTRADMVDEVQRASIREQIMQYAPNADWLEALHAPRGFVNCPTTTDHRPPTPGHRILAFCGIGNPAGFRHTLETSGCNVVELLEFSDHHNYVAGDLAKIAAVAKRKKAAAIVCTQKDLVKINVSRLSDVPLWALRIELKIAAGQEALETRLQSLAQSARPNVA